LPLNSKIDDFVMEEINEIPSDAVMKKIEPVKSEDKSDSELENLRLMQSYQRKRK